MNSRHDHAVCTQAGTATSTARTGNRSKHLWTELADTSSRLTSASHIFAQDIIKLVNEMAPKLVIPIHTFEPQNFEAHFQNVRVLNDGEPFEV